MRILKLQGADNSLSAMCGVFTVNVSAVHV